MGCRTARDRTLQNQNTETKFAFLLHAETHNHNKLLKNGAQFTTALSPFPPKLVNWGSFGKGCLCKSGAIESYSSAVSFPLPHVAKI